MAISSSTFAQAREALISAHQQRTEMLRHVSELGIKISDLECEVQRQAGARSKAEQALCEARQEIEALRSQLPDAATLRAHDSLAEYLANPSELQSSLRMAA